MIKIEAEPVVDILYFLMACKLVEPMLDFSSRLIARMLVRQPEKRATLDEIAKDPWLKNIQSDNVTKPLASRENISEEDHNVIVEKMISGGVATKELIAE